MIRGNLGLPRLTCAEQARMRAVHDRAIGHDRACYDFVRMLTSALPPTDGRRKMVRHRDVGLKPLWKPIGQLFEYPGRERGEQDRLRTPAAADILRFTEIRGFPPPNKATPWADDVAAALYRYFDEEVEIALEVRTCLSIYERRAGFGGSNKLAAALIEAETWIHAVREMLDIPDLHVTPTPVYVPVSKHIRTPELKALALWAASHGYFNIHFREFYQSMLARKHDNGKIVTKGAEPAELALADVHRALAVEIELYPIIPVPPEDSPAGMRLEELRQIYGFPPRDSVTPWTDEVQKALADYVDEELAILLAIQASVPSPSEKLDKALQKALLNIEMVRRDFATWHALKHAPRRARKAA